MDFAVDLHIHSALSPCADNEMTPNNIVNMSILKGLDIISVCDHNYAANLPAISKAAASNGIMMLPGIEVQTKEEIHMLCYFKTLESAVEFGDIIYSKLPNIKNNEEIFGKQLVMDSEDNIVAIPEKLLLSSANISVRQLMDLTSEYMGVCIPAHIDRGTFSIISNLGFIPRELSIKTVEISKNMTGQLAVSKHPYIKGLKILKSSDAHYLWDILEKENFIPLDELTYTNILNYLRGL